MVCTIFHGGSNSHPIPPPLPTPSSSFASTFLLLFQWNESQIFDEFLFSSIRRKDEQDGFSDKKEILFKKRKVSNTSDVPRFAVFLLWKTDQTQQTELRPPNSVFKRRSKHNFEWRYKLCYLQFEKRKNDPN